MGIVRGELQACESVSVPDGLDGVTRSGQWCQTLLWTPCKKKSKYAVLCKISASTWS